ncbi:MAG TPA: TIM barrel protein [Candidatus Saccharimonadales bacterium]|nr:TIM barrel protein [Candidatus Saccharimonadales bacterium]
MPRFSANLEYLFTEVPFIERFGQAASAGFRAVEMHWLHGRDVAAIRAELDRTDLALDAINVFCGDFPAGDRGFAAEPSRRGEFRASVEQAIADATRLGVPKMHILVGKRIPDRSRAEQFGSVAVNLAWAAERLAGAGKVGLIEGLNPIDNPGYLIESMADLVGLLNAVGSPALAIQFDFYHLQRVQGELLRTFARLRDRVGHIQIADAPGRNEPGTGEINYRTVLKAIDEAGYTGYVGLEYRPTGSTEDSLAWIDEYGYHRGG